MRILWFTGVQLPPVTGRELDRAGWQEGLRKALNRYYPDLELSIASFGTEEYQSFTVDNATYYNIFRQPTPENRWLRLVNNWKHEVFSDDELDRCLEIVATVQPDLIFIFGTENPFGLLANRFPVPVIISIQAVLNGLVKKLFHGLTLIELLREFFSRDTLIGEGIFHRKWQLLKLAEMEEEIYNRCMIFEGRTEWDESWLNKLNRKAVYFHIDRILAEDYYQHSWNLEDSEPNVLFTTSSNAPFKGGITLIRALIELKKRGWKNLHLRIAGIHPDSIVGRNIQRLVKKHHLDSQVSILGRIQPNVIIREMKNARLFVLPSHMDNSPNSLGEAMLLGMPCITSNAGGIPSMLEDGKEGIIYDHSNIFELADKIELLLNDTSLAVTCAENAREKAAQRHDPQHIADLTVHMYQQVISGNVQARSQLPEKRHNLLEKILNRLEMVYHVSRFGKLPEGDLLINPYLSKRELEEIKRVFPLPKFFIYGHARSGTTLIARLVRVHPDVHCNYQAHFFSRPPTIYALIDSPDVREWLSRPDNRWNQGKDLSPVILRIVADYIMEREANQFGKRIVGDKSPNSLLDGRSVQKLYSIYPDGKLIYIARDGRDTILSHRFQAFIDFKETLDEDDLRIREDFIYHPEQFLQGRRSLFTRHGLIHSAQSWVRNMQETDNLGRDRFGANYKSLKYEDLIDYPVSEMKKVWQFLEVSPDFPQIEDIVNAELNKNPDAEWQRHQEKNLVANIKKGSSGSWRELFTEQDKEIFLDVAGEVLEQWGYDLD